MRYREIIDPPALAEARLINPQAPPRAKLPPERTQVQAQFPKNGADPNASALHDQLSPTR
jgi:hypothetical protein